MAFKPIRTLPEPKVLLISKGKTRAEIVKIANGRSITRHLRLNKQTGEWQYKPNPNFTNVETYAI